MSTSPYSIDLRGKVINFISKGGSQVKAAETFGLHRNTVNRWYIRQRKEGHCQARIRHGAKSNVDLQSLHIAVEGNPNIPTIELGKLFKISTWHVCRLLKKMGYRYKKKPSRIWKLVHKNVHSSGKL